jgi:uncharacterized protein Yka (UPF0111/DUF47 family)
MVLKTRIVDELGESALLLPSYLNSALAANDRVKYYFSLLQAAQMHADRPAGEWSSLREEREASGVEDGGLDAVVGGSRREDTGGYHIPLAGHIQERMHAEIAEMLKPLTASGSASRRASDYQRRLDAMTTAAPDLSGEKVPADYVGAVTTAQRKRGDSLHLLVMDLHKELNRLQTAIAVETIDGAAVYGLDDADRALVKAFMGGLHSTAPLKFDHPGLGTTATRTGSKLVIQNDIGTTDAHVMVIHVTDLTTILTYSDVHLRRARFFQDLFEPFGVRWEGIDSRQVAGLAESEEFYVCLGHHVARDRAELERYLAFTGSRLVFLIDWNRARKRLRQFIRSKDAIGILKWAADNNTGHRGFLQAGGENLLYGAIERAARTPIRYGQRLDEVLGTEAVADFLKFVLRTAADGLREGRSVRWIRDEVTAELLNHFQSAEHTILSVASDHATLIAEIAEVVRGGVLHGAGSVPAQLLRAATRAKQWETRADDLVNRVREMVSRSPGTECYRTLIGEQDDVADSLEEAAFLLVLMADIAPADGIRATLQQLAGAVVDASHELIKCLECALLIQRGAPREDMQDFLEAVDRALTLEHRTDDIEREIRVGLIRERADSGQIQLYSQIAARLEEAADSASRTVLRLRDHVLGEVMTL